MYLLELAGEDDRFAAREAATAATDVAVVAPGLATAQSIDPDRVRVLAFTHRAVALVARSDPAPAAVSATVRALPADADRTGTIRVRARDVRGAAAVDTAAVERSVGRALVDRGHAVDLETPDHEFRVLFAADRCWMGWLACEADRDFAARKPTDKPFFQPGSMDPPLARAIANIAGARPGRSLLDPMAGTGGLLIEAGLAGATVVGFDAQRHMIAGAVRNCRSYLSTTDWHLGIADAGALPLATDAVDAVVFDAPYGRQSKIAAAGRSSLLRRALGEAARVAPRAVVVADRPLEPELADAPWALAGRYPRRVHRSLTRHVHVLELADESTE